MKPEGTYLVWIDLAGLSIPVKEAFDRLVKAGVGLSPGHLFGNGGETFVRLNMGCPKSVLQEALVKMNEALAEF